MKKNCVDEIEIIAHSKYKRQYLHCACNKIPKLINIWKEDVGKIIQKLCAKNIEIMELETFKDNIYNLLILHKNIAMTK